MRVRSQPLPASHPSCLPSASPATHPVVSAAADGQVDLLPLVALGAASHPSGGGVASDGGQHGQVADAGPEHVVVEGEAGRALGGGAHDGGQQVRHVANVSR